MATVCARFSSLASTWGMLGAMILCTLLLAGRSTGDPATRESCSLEATVPTSACTRARLDVRGSERLNVAEVRVNGRTLIDRIDYTIVDDASNARVVVFNAPLRSGDRLQVTALAPDRSDPGEISFR